MFNCIIKQYDVTNGIIQHTMHINNMFYTGPDTMYEELGPFCQYGGMYIYKSKVCKTDQGFSINCGVDFYAQHCTTVSNIEYLTNGMLYIIFIAYKYYSNFVIDLDVDSDAFKLRHINHENYFEVICKYGEIHNTIDPNKLSLSKFSIELRRSRAYENSVGGCTMNISRCFGSL